MLHHLVSFASAPTEQHEHLRETDNDCCDESQEKLVRLHNRLQTRITLELGGGCRD
jgi:hypothetical protein